MKNTNILHLFCYLKLVPNAIPSTLKMSRSLLSGIPKRSLVLLLTLQAALVQTSEGVGVIPKYHNGQNAQKKIDRENRDPYRRFRAERNERDEKS